MPAPVAKLKKSEIVWLSRNKCRHGHDYLSHYNCYIEENPDTARIGFLDIEASNLKANFGIMLTWCIKKRNGEILEDAITEKDLKAGKFDKRIVKSLVEAISEFDMLVTYFGTGFDLPFLRSRAVHMGIPFPNYGEVVHKDLYYVIKSKFKLTRSSLETACRFLLNDTNKTHIDYTYWINALRGDKESIEYILEHNRMDVVDTERLYNAVVDFNRPASTSM